MPRSAPAEAATLRRAAEAGTVEGACAVLDLDPDDPLATLTDRPPSLWRALAAAARERGREHPLDDERRRLRTELEAVDADVDDAGDASDALAAARRRAATAGADVERLREQAATLRGRLTQARERTSADTEADSDAAETTVDALRAEFEAATRALTEAETERVAAEQALADAVERSRAARDARERRLHLRDALTNRRREIRRDLAREVYPAFVDAVATFRSNAACILGGDSATRDSGVGDSDAHGTASDGSLTARPGDGPDDFDGDAVVAHAAAVRIADRADPVVVAVDRFPSPEKVHEWLGSPVVFVAPD
ncbi:hypothetical protein GRX01_10395 [Halobaculum sp. WSA2]|uniref:Uncharacterized protein n=1 Tax=Halobaculum saliterrae TaxID=2073113 RepID=A0A6B0SYN8_9EURY|nr:hypothetical protein [Halobaculum saliterrae]MXR41743.1 hypothetical protein [Halobaculum saliterrae]